VGICCHSQLTFVGYFANPFRKKNLNRMNTVLCPYHSLAWVLWPAIDNSREKRTLENGGGSRKLVSENNIKQRTMNLQLAPGVVVNEA